MNKDKSIPKVSVIVPVYNLDKYVTDCIESLMQQETSFPFEVIAADDASTDNSFQQLTRLAKHYPENLRILKNPENMGLARTMKRLLSETRGEYIAYLDGDDLALPGKLQSQADYLDNNPDCTIVYHESDVFDSETDKTLWTYSKDYYNWNYISQKGSLEDVVQYGCFMQASTVMVRRHGFMVEAVDETNSILLDHPWHVMNLVYGKGSIDYIDKTLGRYRIHKDSFGAQTLRSVKRREQVLEDQLNVCQIALKHNVDRAIVQNGIFHYIYATALFFLKAHNNELFLKYIKKSTDGQWFFEEKHKIIFMERHQPDQLRQVFFNDPVR